ncbi:MULTISPECIES: helix-turn-helix domain-containing protein [Clostridium]|uniref:helix-turn-helix domain-containing protein n=1 Tax=Clostridium TaxID=1485 RepID=UPI000DFB24C9|nr:helix-turn-helix domain containing protein [Clostridium sporogenes]MCW6085567.1 helix-turn-helix domain containing protein [Clostridium sporogenes]STC76619.1 DNA-binding protein [Clostridium botulinum]
MLDEAKINCIEYLVAGVEKTEIAKLIGKSRQAIYDWINKDEEFKGELAKRLRERKTEATRKINNKLPQALDKVWYLIENAQSEKVKSDLLKYWIDRELGTPTSKVADVTDKDDKKDDFVNLDTIAKDIKENNIIELDKKKAR